MQVSIEQTSGLERRLKIGVPADEVDNEVTTRLQKAVQTVRVDGFRKGKVPLKVVRQRYGAGVRQEVVGEIVNKTFYEAVTQQDLRPAGRPSIEPVIDEPGRDLEYVAVFEVYPEVAVADFSDIAIKRPVATVSDADVAAMVKNLREQHATWIDVSRAAQTGDQVNIDYAGTRDGVAFDGGSAEGTDLELGSGRMIPGFEDAIIGLAAGDQKIAKLSFPEDYQSEELRGAAVEFAITVNAIRERQLAELNDEFFARFGINSGGEEKFLEEIRANMERELKTAIKNKVKTRLMNELLARHQIELPRALLDSEITALRQQMMAQFGGGGRGIDENMLPADLFMPQARRRVTLGLVIAQIVSSANLKVAEEKVREQIEQLAATYEQPQEVIKYYYANEQLLGGIQSAVLEDQVVEHVLDAAQVSEEVVSYEDAIKPDPQPAPDTPSEIE